MENALLIDFYPLIFDITEEYESALERGMSHEAICEMICNDRWCELHDPDERDIVWISLALAQAEAGHSDESIKQKALLAIESYLQDSQLSADMIEAFEEAARLIKKPKKHTAKSPRTRKRVLPDWKIGDTFAHLLSHPLTSRAGLVGWYVLFRKTGEYIHPDQKTRQLGYLSLCPPGKLPSTKEELEALGYLRVMDRSRRNFPAWDYLVQIDIQSKKTERDLQMEYIGNFQDVAMPPNEVPPKPLVSMTFFTRIEKQTLCPSYESHICLMFERNGISKIEDDTSLL